MEEMTIEYANKIIREAKEFAEDNAEEFQTVCDNIAAQVNGQNVSMGTLALTSVLIQLMGSFPMEEREAFVVRVMVLINTILHNKYEDTCFDLIDKSALN